MVVLIALSPARAGSSYLGNITEIFAYPSNAATFFFITDGTRVSPPSCATVPNRWVIDVSSPSGQAAAALVLSAKAQGKKVQVQGSGNCGLWSDTETVASVSDPN